MVKIERSWSAEVTRYDPRNHREIRGNPSQYAKRIGRVTQGFDVNSTKVLLGKSTPRARSIRWEFVGTKVSSRAPKKSE